MDIAYIVLDVINIVCIAITTIVMSVQVIYMILSLFVKKVTFKEAETKHKVCVLIPARNESQVVGNLIGDLLSQDYPRDKMDVVAIAHNCTDNTAEVAREAGAEAFVCQSEQRTKGMALKLAIDNYLTKDYDFFIVIDADCRVEKDYISKMNDAFDSGANIARSYLGNINTFDNAVSQVTGLYNIRECRMNARVREHLGYNSQLIGNSFFMSRAVLEDFGGFPSTDSLTEDSDFMVKAMLKGYKVQYVEDAICYTEVTNTIKESFKRNMRIGKGVNSDLWRGGHKLFGRFAKTGKLTYLDIFLTLAFLPLSVISVVWFPLYYIFLAVSMMITGGTAQMMFIEINLPTLGFMAAGMLFGMIFMFSAQAILCLILQKDRLLQNNKWTDYIKGILAFPYIMMLTNLAITLGILNKKQKWDSIKRTTGKTKSIDGVSAAPVETEPTAPVDSLEVESVEHPQDNEKTE